VVRRGHRAGGRLLVVHLLSGSVPDAPVRAGFVVSKAVGPAVTRNLVKRRLRHLFRELLADQDALPDSAMLVVRALPPAASASYTELRAELERCLGRARQAGRPPVAAGATR
jgi:ribonuclease P protein component